MPGPCLPPTFCLCCKTWPSSFGSTAACRHHLVQHLRASLLQNAVNNIVKLGPQGALTGPASRGDTALLAAQGQALQDWNASAGQAYQALSALARQLAQRKKPI